MICLTIYVPKYYKIPAIQGLTFFGLYNCQDQFLAICCMEHVSVWGSVSAVDHRSVAALELMPKGEEVIPLALSRYDTLKKKLETCGGVFGDQADHRVFFPWRMAEKKKRDQFLAIPQKGFVNAILSANSGCVG